MRVRKAGGGRKKVLRPCPYCKEEMGARELREHIVKCGAVEGEDELVVHEVEAKPAGGGEYRAGRCRPLWVHETHGECAVVEDTVTGKKFAVMSGKAIGCRDEAEGRGMIEAKLDGYGV
jgi:hypothetical protein